MSRPRADTIASGPRLRLVNAECLEADGQWGVDELPSGGVGIVRDGNAPADPSGHASSRGGGHKDGGEVITHDLYGDYDEDAGGDTPTSSTPSPNPACNNNNNNNGGVTITRQEGFQYRSEGGAAAAGDNSNSSSSGTTINRWSIENNVALLVLKKELQIDRSAVRERRVAKKLESVGGMATPRAIAGSMTPRGGTLNAFTPRGSITPRPMSSGAMSPRGSTTATFGSSGLDFSRLANSTMNGNPFASTAFLMDGGIDGTFAPPPPIVVKMTDAALLSRPVQSEVDFLKAKCAELESAAGIQSGEDIVTATRNLHRRIHLLDERVVEELSNRVDVTSAAIRNRDRNKDTIAKDANMTEREMADAFGLSKIVDECYDLHIDALQIIKRLHSLRMVHQEVFQRVGALSLLRAATLDTNTFITNAPDEIEEMRLGTKEVNGAVNESLAFFRSRLQTLAATAVAHKA